MVFFTRAVYFVILSILLEFGLTEKANAIAPSHFCGPLLKTYQVEDTTYSRVSSGIRCVNLDNTAFYGEGFWGRSLQGRYKQMGVIFKNANGAVVSVQMIDLGLRRLDPNTCQPEMIGQPGAREISMKSFSRVDRYGVLQNGFELSDIGERWVEVTDLNALDGAPLDGLADGNDCMTFTGVQFATVGSKGAFRCVFPNRADPFSSNILLWVGKNEDGTLEMGWSTSPGLYANSKMDCEGAGCTEVHNIEIKYAMPEPPIFNRTFNLVGGLLETWIFRNPSDVTNVPHCH